MHRLSSRFLQHLAVISAAGFAFGCSDGDSDTAGEDAGAASDVVEGDASPTDTEPAPGPDADAPDAEGDASADVVDDAPPLPESFSMTEDDFRCITDYAAVRGFFIGNELGRLDEAIATAEAGFATEVPPGTVIQLIPQEAMVKGLPGSSPETDDWEFFILNPTADGTVITDRGFTEISNVAGTCWSCHAGASERDGVCEQTGLCADAALPRAIIDSLVASDARCAD
jgi:hypothetical protein